IGNFDAGTVADDVRLTFTAPTANNALSYQIQRALIGTTTGSATTTNCRLGAIAPATSDTSGSPTGSTFSTVGSVSVAAGKQGSFTNADPGNGGFCYRVVVQDPIAGILCGSNATCVVQDRSAGGTNNELLITMTTSPSTVANGSVAGAQFPLVVTDTAGITDLSGNAWNLTGSPDRLFYARKTGPS